MRLGLSFFGWDEVVTYNIVHGILYMAITLQNVLCIIRSDYDVQPAPTVYGWMAYEPVLKLLPPLN